MKKVEAKTIDSVNLEVEIAESVIICHSQLFGQKGSPKLCVNHLQDIPQIPIKLVEIGGMYGEKILLTLRLPYIAVIQ